MSLEKRSYSLMVLSIKVNLELALTRDTVLVSKSGLMAPSMKVTGETTLHLAEANSSTSMVMSTMVKLYSVLN